MPKTQIKFVCQQCGYESAKWMGRCPDCGEWNSLVETVVPPARGGEGRSASLGGTPAAAVPLPQVQATGYQRLPTGSSELDRVLGGGVVPGSVVLVAGDPGIGKCLAGYTRVLDPESGLFLPISDWAHAERPILSLDEATRRLSPQPVSAFLDQGLQPVVEVTTRLGRTLRCTPTHPLLTPNGWRAVSELAPRDRVAAPCSLPYFGKDSLPEHMIQLVVLALPGKSAEGDAAAARRLDEAGIRWESVGAEAALPECIFRLPKAQMALFLRTLFTRDAPLYVHGEHAEEPETITYSTSSRQLAEDIAHLLLRFGILAARSYHDTYALRIAGDFAVALFRREIGLGEYHGSGGQEAPSDGGRNNPESAESDISWDVIESIDPAGQEQVYDLTVPGHANFVANDLIVHNSTILLQVAGAIAANQADVLYVSAEESAQQVKMRAERLGITTERLLLLPETETNAIIEVCERSKPALIVVDSIQTVGSASISSAPGSVSQVRDATLRLMRLAKSSQVPVFIIGHVTKEGMVAGPRTLEHIVDAVLYLEGERFHSYRLLRGVKNRFGATNEVGVFEMHGEGMVDVSNPSAIFLAEHTGQTTGSAVIVSMEGTRPLLVEVQALASTTTFGTPRCTTNGLDQNRVLMLLAVLTKRVGLALGNQDVYVNVAGGFTLGEPAVDLGVATAIASSYRERQVAPETVLIGEVGLGGELRSVTRAPARIREAAKLGFKQCILPKSGARDERDLAGSAGEGIKLMRAATLGEALAIALQY